MEELQRRRREEVDRLQNIGIRLVDLSTRTMALANEVNSTIVALKNEPVPERADAKKAKGA